MAALPVQVAAAPAAPMPAPVAAAPVPPPAPVTLARVTLSADSLFYPHNEHLVVFRHGSLDLVDPQHLRRSVPVVDDCSHAVTSSQRFRWMGVPFFQARPAR